MRKLWILLVLLLLAGGAVVLHKRKNGAPKEATVRAVRGDLQVSVEMTGMIEAKKSVNVKSRVNGRILRLYVDEGDRVKVGALLAEVDPDVFQAQVAEQKSNVEAARAQWEQAKLTARLQQEKDSSQLELAKRALAKTKAQLKQAEEDLQRQSALAGKELVSDQQLLAAKTQVEVLQAALAESEQNLKFAQESLERDQGISKQQIDAAEARLSAAQAALEAALKRLHDTKIYSPLSGVVTYRGVEEGDVVASESFGKASGTTIVTISDLSFMYATANVDEVDMAKLKLQQRATITVDAYPDETYPGVIEQIGLQSSRLTSTQATDISTFPLKVKILSQDQRLKPGLTCNIHVVTAERRGVVLVPIEAVHTEEDRSFVSLLKEDGSVEQKSVVTGLRNLTEVEIVKGLKGGERLSLKTMSAPLPENKRQGRRRRF